MYICSFFGNIPPLLKIVNYAGPPINDLPEAKADSIRPAFWKEESVQKRAEAYPVVLSKSSILKYRFVSASHFFAQYLSFISPYDDLKSYYRKQVNPVSQGTIARRLLVWWYAQSYGSGGFFERKHLLFWRKRFYRMNKLVLNELCLELCRSKSP